MGAAGGGDLQIVQSNVISNCRPPTVEGCSLSRIGWHLVDLTRHLPLAPQTPSAR